MVDFSDMAEEQTEVKKEGLVGALFNVGAHLGYSRARRHASMKDLIFGSKGKNDIIDLSQSAARMEASLEFVRSLGASGKTMLFVGGKPEVRDITRQSADTLNMPYVAGRWIGGTLTNFQEIKKRVQRLAELTQDKEAGTLAKKYTKKERLLLDREMDKLEETFGGLSGMEQAPQALVVVDTRAESIAVKEANDMNIPVIGIMNSDCDLSVVQHPLIGNDASRASVEFFLEEIVKAYREGTQGAVEKKAPEESTK